jgi:hypothetical protein
VRHRVATYTDNDPLVAAYAEALLADSLQVAAVHADLRDPDRLLTQPAVRTHIDLDQPVAVLLVAVLHFIEDREDPWSILDAYKAHMAPGSYLVLSHVTSDGSPATVIRQATEVYQHASAPGLARSRAQITRFFDGLDMAAPGLVDPCQWRRPGPARQPRPTLFYAGIGRTPATTGETAP